MTDPRPALKQISTTSLRLRAFAAPLKRRVTQRAAATHVEYVFIVTIVSIAGVLLLFAIGQRTAALLEMTNSNMPH